MITEIFTSIIFSFVILLVAFGLSAFLLIWVGFLKFPANRKKIDPHNRLLVHTALPVLIVGLGFATSLMFWTVFSRKYLPVTLGILIPPILLVSFIFWELRKRFIPFISDLVGEEEKKEKENLS